ncbi:MAG: SagB/ThcOx family dehydrogenase [Candidatus Heimdallarchaeota archaeon]
MKSGRRDFLKFALLTAFAGLVSIAAILFGEPQLERFVSEIKLRGGVKVIIDRVKLPSPKLKGELSVEEAIARRRSRRDYLNEPIKLEELSNLLWAAQGITEPVNKFRTAPSAGATYPLEVYVVIRKGGVEELSEGLYHYNLYEHVLEKYIEGDLSEELSSAAVSQEWVRKASINIILTAIYERTTERYGERGKQYVHMEVGHVGENIYLQAESLELGAVVIGAFYDDWIQRLLKLPGKEKPLYIISVGRPI